MNPKNDLSRITVDIPKECHKKLKATAAILGKSMREVIIESIEEHLFNKKIPNKKTIQAMKDVEKRKNLSEAKSVKDLFKKLGI